MKKRLNWIGRQLLFWVAAFTTVLTFPAWIIFWVITGKSVIDILNRFQDPEFWRDMDKIKAETKEMEKKTAAAREFMSEIKKEKRTWIKNKDGTFSSIPNNESIKIASCPRCNLMFSPDLQKIN